MKYLSYEDYVKDTKEFYKDRKLSVPIEFMILSKEYFDIFNGVIEFGAGSKNLTNKPKCNNCTCAHH